MAVASMRQEADRVRRTSRITALLIAVASLVTSAPPALAAASGTELWVAYYDGPASLLDGAKDLAVSPDGATVYITGYSEGATRNDFRTVAYNAVTGEQRWASRYDDPIHGADIARSIGVTTDGSIVIVTGRIHRPSGTDFATIGYDAATGAQVWVRRYDTPRHWVDDPMTLVISPRGKRVFVTGSTTRHLSSTDYLTVAYRTADGARLWARRFDSPRDQRHTDIDTANAIAIDPHGGRVFVTGRMQISGHVDDFATVAYATRTGETLWMSRYDGPDDAKSRATAVTASPDGASVFVTGWTARTTISDYDYATIAYRATDGARIWARTYTLGVGLGADIPSSLATSPDGTRLFVTGYSHGDTEDDLTTLAYDASSGRRRWLARHETGAGWLDAQAFAMPSPDGSQLFVASIAYDSASGSSYLTLAYDAATGTQSWSASFPSAAPQAMGVDPAGTRVFVTGGGGPDSDFATVAYQA